MIITALRKCSRELAINELTFCTTTTSHLPVDHASHHPSSISALGPFTAYKDIAIDTAHTQCDPDPEELRLRD
jgi:hypothetical protein